MMANEFSLDSIQITIPKRSKNSHKGDFGRALILAGSEGMGEQQSYHLKHVYFLGLV